MSLAGDVSRPGRQSLGRRCAADLFRRLTRHCTWAEKHLAGVPKARVDENGLEVVETGSHRRGILEELEKAHIYVEQLNGRLKEQESRITGQRELIEKLTERLAVVESGVSP